MTAPSQEAVSAIPDAEVRELIAKFIDREAFDVFDAEYNRVGSRGPTHEQINVIGRMLAAREKADAILSLLASRPTREEIRDEALEERIREDERDRLYAEVKDQAPIPAAFFLCNLKKAMEPNARAALRSRTPAPSRNHE